MTKYRKKPVEVEAMEWTGGPEAAAPIINWILETGTRSATWSEERTFIELDEDTGQPTLDENGLPDITVYPEHISVNTLEGTMRADVGDFIIKGVSNEHYPCKPDIFWLTYEEVDE